MLYPSLSIGLHVNKARDTEPLLKNVILSLIAQNFSDVTILILKYLMYRWTMNITAVLKCL